MVGAIDAMSRESPMRFPILRERRVVAVITEGSTGSMLPKAKVGVESYDEPQRRGGKRAVLRDRKSVV